MAATAFAYRLALSQGRVERDAVEAARRAYLLAGGDLERAGATVDKIVATESRTRHLWLKRPLHPRIVQALLPK